MSHNKNKDTLSHIKSLTSQQLKVLLAKLEHEHDILQAKNEELTIQISDLRNAVKCVESQRKDTVAFELQKKKKLQDKIESLEKGIKYATKNHPYQAMQAFKVLMQ